MIENIIAILPKTRNMDAIVAIPRLNLALFCNISMTGSIIMLTIRAMTNGSRMGKIYLTVARIITIAAII
jgi:hypothetical protein